MVQLTLNTSTMYQSMIVTSYQSINQISVAPLFRGIPKKTQSASRRLALRFGLRPRLNTRKFSGITEQSRKITELRYSGIPWCFVMPQKDLVPFFLHVVSFCSCISNLYLQNCLYVQNPPSILPFVWGCLTLARMCFIPFSLQNCSKAWLAFPWKSRVFSKNWLPWSIGNYLSSMIWAICS